MYVLNKAENNTQQIICPISECASTAYTYRHTHACRVLVHFFQSSDLCEHFSFPLSLLIMKWLWCISSGVSLVRAQDHWAAIWKHFKSSLQSAPNCKTKKNKKMKWFQNIFFSHFISDFLFELHGRPPAASDLLRQVNGHLWHEANPQRPLL